MKAVLAVLLLCVLLMPVVAHGQSGPTNGRIAFTISQRGGSSETYTINPDGTDLTQLIFENDFDGFDMQWSPDGAHILFSSDKNGENQVFVMNADGSDLVSLTPNQIATDAHWSPDGRMIAYAGHNRDGSSDIYVMNADGSNVVNLTTIPNEYILNRYPFWSPDGEFIYFATSRIHVLEGEALVPVQFDLYRMRLDGSDLTHIFFLGSRTRSVSISPDGQFFLYITPSYPDQTIAIRRVDTLEETALIENSKVYNPVWSPDGHSIAFFVYRSGAFSLMVADMDGSHQQVLWTGESNTVVGKLSWLPALEE